MWPFTVFEKVSRQLQDVQVRLSRIETQLLEIKKGQNVMSVEMDALVASVAAEGTVVGGIEVAIRGLRDQLAKAIADGADPAMLTRLKNDIDGYTARLVAAAATPAP